jgi:hypothetical protein
MKRALANGLLLAATLALTLVAAELVLRAAGIGYPQFYRPDPLRGSSHLPGAAGRYEREGSADVSINAAGFRDREHDSKKAPDAYRIAFLGDSYTEALQVDVEATFWKVTERELAKCPAFAGKRIEALNFGVSSYGTGQELVTLRTSVWAYQPDLVVLAFLTGNDVRNNARELQDGDLQPYFVVQDGALVLDDSFRESADWIRTQSPLWRVKQWLLVRSNLMQLVWELRVIAQRKRMMEEQRGLDDPVFRPPQDPAWSKGWDVTERLLRLMNDEVAARGAAFQLMTLTNPAQVDPDVTNRERKARSVGMPDLLYPDRRVAEFARAEGIPVLTLVDRMAAEAVARGVCLHGFPNTQPCTGHWNEEGHRLAGSILAETLCARRSAEAAAPPR